MSRNELQVVAYKQLAQRTACWRVDDNVLVSAVSNGNLDAGRERERERRMSRAESDGVVLLAT